MSNHDPYSDSSFEQSPGKQQAVSMLIPLLDDDLTHVNLQLYKPFRTFKGPHWLASFKVH
jgi:hypothetical protein